MRWYNRRVILPAQKHWQCQRSDTFNRTLIRPRPWRSVLSIVMMADLSL